MEAKPQLDATTAATEKIWAAINGLSKNDLYRLDLAARTCLFGTEFREPAEIIHEALVRALDGSRRWPHQRVPFVAFLIRTMQSLADASRKSPKQARTEPIDACVMEGGLSAGSQCALVMVSPEEIQIESEHEAERQRNAVVDIEKINGYFENDCRVRLLITYLNDGKSAHAICAVLRWTDTEYATVRKRLRRGLAKLFHTRKKR